MTTERDSAGFVHELLVYDSLPEFGRFIESFASDGRAALEPTFVVVLPEHRATAEAAVAGIPGVEVDVIDPRVATAGHLLRQRRETAGGFADSPAGRGRMVSEIPHPGVGAYGDEWVRYEVASNHAFAGAVAWGVCAFERSRTPRSFLDLMERCHPWVSTAPLERAANERYERPAALWDELPPSPPDPLEELPPAIRLTDPLPAAARDAVTLVTRHLADRDRVDALVLAVSEGVTNARMHADSPVELRVWVSARRALAAIHDPGSGPSQPLTGMVPGSELGRSDGGLGLWLAHQLVHTTHRRDSDGYTLRLATRPPGA